MSTSRASITERKASHQEVFSDTARATVTQRTSKRMESTNSNQTSNFDDWYNEPRVVPIVNIKQNSPTPLQIDAKALEKVLFHENVRQLPVVVLCIAGAFRSGKSFIINFLLRYLSAKSWQQSNAEHENELHPWLGSDKSASLNDGFPWQSGTKSHTDGIVAWSRPIRVKRNGKEHAVLILDTQGTFDMRTSAHQMAASFAFSALLSSVLVCNVRGGQIGSDLLEQLQFFAGYGQSAAARADGRSSSSTANRPLQTLILLVRDWLNPSEDAFGESGGRTYLNKVFDTNSSQVKGISSDLHQCFQELRCVLLPRPGDCITDKSFSGSIDQLSPTFVQHTASFTEMLASLACETPKQIDGKLITCEELFTHALQYADLLNRAPAVSTWYETTLETNDRIAIDAALEEFDAFVMQKLRESEKKEADEAFDFSSVAKEAKQNAVEVYNEKHGNTNFEKFDGQNKTGKLQLALQARCERFREIIERHERTQLKSSVKQLRCEVQSLLDERAAREAEYRLLTTGSEANRNVTDTVLDFVEGFGIVAAKSVQVLTNVIPVVVEGVQVVRNVRATNP